MARYEKNADITLAGIRDDDAHIEPHGNATAKVVPLQLSKEPDDFWVASFRDLLRTFAVPEAQTQPVLHGDRIILKLRSASMPEVEHAFRAIETFVRRVNDERDIRVAQFEIELAGVRSAAQQINSRLKFHADG